MTTLKISRLKPAGGKSPASEQIVNVFARQEGHLSADDLVDLIRREISGSAAPPSTEPCSG